VAPDAQAGALGYRDVLARDSIRAAFFTGEEGQKRRTQNIVDFHDDPACRVLFATDAGGVGLSLQRAASACINIELPWNPAVLEQRIGRIYRLGQKRPIHVYNLVSEPGIESRISDLVGTKKVFHQPDVAPDERGGVVAEDVAGGDAADLEVTSPAPQHAQPLGDHVREAHEVGHDVSPEAARELAHGLDPALGTRQVVDAERVVGAEGARQLETVGAAVDGDDGVGAHVAGDGHRVDPEAARSLDDQALAEAQARLLEAVERARPEWSARRDYSERAAPDGREDPGPPGGRHGGGDTRPASP
jgi:Helicase conserved C-terminal domain